MERTNRLRFLIPVLVVISAFPVMFEQEKFGLLMVLTVCAVGTYVLVDRLKVLVAPTWMVSTAVLLVSAWLVVNGVLNRPAPVLALGYYMIHVCICKLFGAKTIRDDGQFLILSMLLMVIGAIVSGRVYYPLCLAVWLTLAVYALVLLHFRREYEGISRIPNRTDAHSSDPLNGADPLTARLGLVTIGITATMGLIAVVVFMTFPRVSTNLLGSFRGAGGTAITGFSYDVSFGDVRRIQESNALVMQVRLRLNGQPYSDMSEALYFRGVTLERYNEQEDGRFRWQTEDQVPNVPVIAPSQVPHPLFNDDQGPFNSTLLDRLDIIEQEYLLEPGHNRNLFCLYPPLAVASQSLRRAYRDVRGETLHPETGMRGRTQYVVLSAWGNLPDGFRRDYVVRSGPPTRIDPEYIPVSRRVRDFTAQLVSNAGDPLDAARHETIAEAIRDYLDSDEFAYTLDLADMNLQREPVEELLFYSKKGHCEYFATAMVVMCQLSGIPARIVNGFLGGDYNKAEEVYRVRSKHAHSWVEVWLPNMGWERFDPTPSSRADSSGSGKLFALIGDWITRLQYAWVTLVVDFNREHQGSLRGTFSGWLTLAEDANRGFFAGLWERARRIAVGPQGLSFAQRMLYWLVLFLAGALAAAIFRILWIFADHVVTWWNSIRWHGDDAFYRRLLKLLARRGLRKSPSQTPREFAREVARQAPRAQGIESAIEAHYQVTYGRRPLSDRQRQQIASLIKSLRASPK